MNPYSLLQVDPRASNEVIKSAFAALSQLHHPDHGGDVEFYKKLINARNLLLDSNRRNKYDESLLKPKDKKIVGSYELIKFIAEGAIGQTYIARHMLTKKLVCLKWCMGTGPEYDDIILNEAGAIWDIRHHAFPAIRDVIKLGDGSLAIVMSYINGPTLEQAIKHLTTIEPEHCLWIMDRLLAGLNYLHANGVVHGDVKPQNIILKTDSHSAVLIDFGLAMIRPNKNDKHAGFTEYFAPPEQQDLKNPKPLIPESDLYALAKTMLYALSGKYLKSFEMWPTTIPKPLQVFLKKLMVEDVNKRPNWSTMNILEEFKNVRVACFGTTNSRGLKFPKVEYDDFNE